MLTSNPKGESPQTASALEVMEAVKVMQQSLQKTDFRLQQVEEASKILGEKQKKMDTKIDSILKFLQNWNMGSEFSSVEKSQRIQITSPTQLGYPKLIVDELASQKQQEFEGKVALHHAPSTTTQISIAISTSDIL
jgi:hypothetical protein